MPNVLSLASPLAAAVLFAAVPPAAAQQAAAGRALPTVVDAGVIVGAAPRTVATYRFTRSRDAAMPTWVTVADSAGAYVANFRLPADRVPRPMMVDVLDSDIVLQGETPAGVLTLRFYGPSDSATTRIITGRWWLGGQQGELRGRIVR